MTQDLYSSLSPASSIAAQTVIAPVNGTGVELSGFVGSDVLIHLGTFGGTTPTATIQIQESDDNVTFAPVAATDLIGGALPATIDTTNAATLYERGYLGIKRYLRVAVTAVGGTGPSLPMSAVIVRGGARKQPV